ncbi:MAG: polysaccharide pyruvyl transferase family protein [Bdellovibrionales bacterium]|nr:polysaccharide pyruvyl transferase family protein [Bdellovibrionales bacterium]
MSDTISIGLLWHSLSSNNLGVGALSLSQIMLLERLSKELNLSLHYRLYGTRGTLDYTPAEITDRICSMHFSPKNLCSPSVSFIREFRRCRLILDIGEGDSFSDIYGNLRFAKLAVSKLIALCSGTPLVLAPQTIGPFAGAASRKASAALIKRCVRTFARDSESLKYAQDLCPGANLSLASDLAFALPFDKNFQHEPEGAVHVGINVSALLFHGGYNSSNQFALAIDYRAFISKLLAKLCGNPSLFVHLIPHVLDTSQHVEDDYQINAELHREFPNVIPAPKFRSPSEAKAYIAGLDFFVGSRMHSTIAAYSSGVPVLPIAYSRKFSSLFGDIGYHHTVDAASVESDDKLVETILQSIENRHLMKAEVDYGMGLVHERIESYENFLRQALQQYCE